MGIPLNFFWASSVDLLTVHGGLYDCGAITAVSWSYGCPAGPFSIAAEGKENYSHNSVTCKGADDVKGKQKQPTPTKPLCLDQLREELSCAVRTPPLLGNIQQSSTLFPSFLWLPISS